MKYKSCYTYRALRAELLPYSLWLSTLPQTNSLVARPISALKSNRKIYNMASSTRAHDTTFPQFARLPTELRHCIWECAMEESWGYRVARYCPRRWVRTAVEPGSQPIHLLSPHVRSVTTYQHEGIRMNLPALAANREAHAACLHWARKNKLSVIYRHGRWPRILRAFEPENDITEISDATWCMFQNEIIFGSSNERLPYGILDGYVQHEFSTIAVHERSLRTTYVKMEAVSRPHWDGPSWYVFASLAGVFRAYRSIRNIIVIAEPKPARPTGLDIFIQAPSITEAEHKPGGQVRARLQLRVAGDPELFDLVEFMLFSHRHLWARCPFTLRICSRDVFKRL